MSRQFTVLVLALFLLFLSLSTTQADSISAPNCAITSTQSTELPTFQAQLPCSMGLYEITGFDVNVSKNPPEFVGIPTLSENSGKILILAQWAMESPGTLIIDVNLTRALLQSSGIWNYTIGSTYHPDWLALYNVIATMDICLGGNFDTNNNCSGNLLTSSTASSTHEVATITIPVPILNELDIHTRSVFTHDGSKPGFDFSGGPALS